MPNVLNGKSVCLAAAIGLLTLSSGLSLSAYEQGSFFLIRISESETAKSDSLAIVLRSTVFSKAAGQPETQISKKTQASEFEMTTLDFGGKKSQPKLTSIQILSVELEEETTTGTSFGETKEAPSGFFFE